MWCTPNPSPWWWAAPSWAPTPPTCSAPPATRRSRLECSTRAPPRHISSRSSSASSDVGLAFASRIAWTAVKALITRALLAGPSSEHTRINHTLLPVCTLLATYLFLLISVNTMCHSQYRFLAPNARR